MVLGRTGDIWYIISTQAIHFKNMLVVFPEKNENVQCEIARKTVCFFQYEETTVQKDGFHINE